MRHEAANGHERRGKRFVENRREEMRREERQMKNKRPPQRTLIDGHSRPPEKADQRVHLLPFADGVLCLAVEGCIRFDVGARSKELDTKANALYSVEGPEEICVWLARRAR